VSIESKRGFAQGEDSARFEKGKKGSLLVRGMQRTSPPLPLLLTNHGCAPKTNELRRKFPASRIRLILASRTPSDPPLKF